MTGRGFFAGAFTVIGALMVAFCGPCMLYFEVGALNDTFSQARSGEYPFYIGPEVPLVVGGIPTLIGIGLFIWGRKLAKPRPAKPQDKKDIA